MIWRRTGLLASWRSCFSSLYLGLSWLLWRYSLSQWCRFSCPISGSFYKNTSLDRWIRIDAWSCLPVISFLPPNSTMFIGCVTICITKPIRRISFIEAVVHSIKPPMTAAICLGTVMWSPMMILHNWTRKPVLLLYGRRFLVFFSAMMSHAFTDLWFIIAMIVVVTVLSPIRLWVHLLWCTFLPGGMKWPMRIIVRVVTIRAVLKFMTVFWRYDKTYIEGCQGGWKIKIPKSLEEWAYVCVAYAWVDQEEKNIMNDEPNSILDREWVDLPDRSKFPKWALLWCFVEDLSWSAICIWSWCKPVSQCLWKTNTTDSWSRAALKCSLSPTSRFTVILQ